ncbi:hypothetical protein [Yinghuangia soli]|uniref:Uncharacterized protein n=1 Tax=Yinghuangia soli TaxID=2908204 RepID=A0AA41Q4V7_9ACTN|nr:hypothetical protein [Yinghuangia soli]MCF2531610.1 hypothetical protein [Yinghuangia soli]
MHPSAQLLDAAPAAVLQDVLARSDAATLTSLLSGRYAPGDALISHVLERGATAHRVDLASNTGLAHAAYDALADDAARVPRPEVAARLLGNLSVTGEVAAKLVPLVTDPAALGIGDDGAHNFQAALASLSASEDPRVLMRVAALLDRDVNALGGYAVLIRCCLGLLDTASAEAVRKAIASVPASTKNLEEPSPAVVAALMAPDNRGLLQSALEHESSTPVILSALRQEASWSSFEQMLRDPRRYGSDAFAVVFRGPRAPLDWDLIRREHRRYPLRHNALGALARQPDCPADLAEAKEPTTRPDSRKPPLRSRIQPRSVRKALLAQLAGNTHKLMSQDVSRGLADGVLSAMDVLTHGRIALAALETLRFPGTRPEESRAAVAAIATTALGPRPEAWAVALRLLPDFPGTFPELISTAKQATR